MALLIFIVRVPVARFGVPKSIPISDASRMAAMAPKGLAAAVLASLPLQQGVPGGDLIQNSTYAVVLFSVILTSLVVFLQDISFVGRFYRYIFKSFAPDESLAPLPLTPALATADSGELRFDSDQEGL
jgi:hypothetical protein